MKILNYLKKFFIYSPPEKDIPFVLNAPKDQPEFDIRNRKQEPQPCTVYDSIEKNREYIAKRFDYPHNNDVVIRELMLNRDTKAFLIYYDGMTDGKDINNNIIKPLLELPIFNDIDDGYTVDTVLQKLITHSQVSMTSDFDALCDDINFGSCGIFIDGINQGYAADVKNWPHRGVDKPENEQSLYGPQEAFAEMLRGNSAQVRKFLKTEKLICEKTVIGKVSRTRGVIMYISDIANTQLVDEVRRRLDGIDMDYVISVEEVSMMLEDNPLLLTSHIQATERPDRVARALSEGRVALILNGSPKALIFPTNAYELTHSASDAYLQANFANMSRIIRICATFISVLLPAIFLAITLFHEEMLPTYLLYAISAARQNVPFPSVVELLLMDFSFEMIREAGIRMPSPIGSVLGIVGGLILGQAAVSAKIVSPIMIIIIAITGIGSFATADYSLGWSYRILKFVYVLLAATFGFFGIAMGIFVYCMLLAAAKSFGIPFLSPLPGNKMYKTAVFVPPIWKQEKRPGYLDTKRRRREDIISKKWDVGR